MAIRTDIQINWATSPRQITVDAPSIELTMQDLLDTLRDRESLDTNIDNPSIVEGSGKVVLDTDGNAVGLTVQLLDATVGFEARPGPTWVECALNGGNLSGLESDGITVTVAITHNNPYVNINKTSSVSATLSEVGGGTIDVEEIANAVWDKAIADHLNPGSTGEALDNGEVIIDLDAIAEAVWNELMAGHKISKSFGDHIRRIKNQKV